MTTTASSSISPKVTAASIAAAVTTLLVWGLQSATSIEVPAGVEAALVTLFTFGAGYLTTDRARGRHVADGSE